MTNQPTRPKRARTPATAATRYLVALAAAVTLPAAATSASDVWADGKSWSGPN